MDKHEANDSDTPCPYSARLLQSLSLPAQSVSQYLPPPQHPLKSLAESGLMFLAGNKKQPHYAPCQIPASAHCAIELLHTLQPLTESVDGARLLAERAALLRLSTQTQQSANGSCYLFKTRDDWIALNLARDDDWQLLPALLHEEKPITTIGELQNALRSCDATELLQQGSLLGLPIAIARTDDNKVASWFSIVAEGATTNTIFTRQPKVLDLSSLWAGPLCSHLLQLGGAEVIKLESTQRPDAARFHSTEGGRNFFALLNRNKQQQEFDLKTGEGIEQLTALIDQADIVIEGSRPRALQQLGIDATQIIEQQAGKLWISITGYGRDAKNAQRVAFGDDAAIAAGIFNIIDNKPAFIGDAIADPLTGIHAALAARALWPQGKSRLVDINLHNVCRWCLQFPDQTSETIDFKNTTEITQDRHQQWQLTCGSNQWHIQLPQERTKNKKAPSAQTTSRLKAGQ